MESIAGGRVAKSGPRKALLSIAFEGHTSLRLLCSWMFRLDPCEIHFSMCLKFEGPRGAPGVDTCMLSCRVFFGLFVCDSKIGWNDLGVRWMDDRRDGWR
jgi:hypothetical protein